ncbi:MAG TPA: hypothetical protein V6D15_24385 [Oculatellaceae cyanobacterium]|jgi:hypothetical protein
MKSQIAYLIASLTVAPSLVACSSNTDTNFPNQAATTASEIDNPLECQDMAISKLSCKLSIPSSPVPSSPIAPPENTHTPQVSSSISNPNLFVPDLATQRLNNRIKELFSSTRLSRNTVSQPRKYANLTSRSPQSKSSQLAKYTPSTQIEASTYNLDYTNTNQASSSGENNTSIIELSQPTVVTEITTDELQTPSYKNNNLVEITQNQTQLPPPSHFQLPTEQLSTELTPNKIQEPITSITPQQVSNNSINSLNTNTLPVPSSTGHYTQDSHQIAPIITNNNAQPSLPTSSNLGDFVEQPDSRLNTNQLQTELNLSPNQLDSGLNSDKTQNQSQSEETTLQSYNNQQTSQSKSLIKSNIQEINYRISELGVTIKQLSQISYSSPLSKTLGKHRLQLSNLKPELPINLKPEFAIKRPKF